MAWAKFIVSIIGLLMPEAFYRHINNRPIAAVPAVAGQVKAESVNIWKKDLWIICKINILDAFLWVIAKNNLE